jgi:opacity protein-like surface antigen
MKRFLATIALACVLSASASAGEVPTSGVPSPQPGEVPTSGVTSPQSGELLPDDTAVLVILLIGLLPG